MLGEIVKNRYVLLEKLGGGGEGVVYLARDLQLGKYWAVKQISVPRAKDLSVIKNLQHPMLPQIADSHRDGTGYYLIMEYISGTTLEKYRKKNKITYLQLLEWGMELCDVLEYFHSQSPPVIYGDLKPSNLMIDKQGKLRLVDFGSLTVPLKQMVTFRGTLGYAAPEIQKGTPFLQSDIYSLGVLLKELSKGRKGRNWGLNRIIRRCTRKNPRKRYSSCKIVKQKLECLKRRKTKKEGRLLLLFAACLLCAFGAGVKNRQDPVVIREEEKKGNPRKRDLSLEYLKTGNLQIDDEIRENTGWEELQRERDRLKPCLYICQDSSSQIWLLERLLWLEYALGEETQAEHYARILLKKFPQREEAYSDLGNLLFLTGKKEESKRLLDRMELRLPQAKAHNTRIWKERVREWEKEKKG